MLDFNLVLQSDHLTSAGWTWQYPEGQKSSSKIIFADRHELSFASLKHHGGLTATLIKNL